MAETHSNFSAVPSSDDPVAQTYLHGLWSKLAHTVTGQRGYMIRSS